MIRTRGQILFKILMTCRMEQNRSHIAEICGLDEYALKRYLDLLIEKNLIKVYAVRPVLYETTDKGFEALDRLKVINEFMPGWFK